MNGSQATTGKYAHKEAFAFMYYQDQVTREVEVIWNSRDGVTPFCITSKAGNEAQHVHFGLDTCSPNHLPDVGDRVFVDLTLDRAREGRRRFVEKWWDHEVHGQLMRDAWATKYAAIEDLALGDVGTGHQPDLIVVTEEWLEQLAASRRIS